MNLWLADGDGSNPRILVSEEAEVSYPTWVTGKYNFDWLDDDNIVFSRNVKGFCSLAHVHIPSQKVVHLTSLPSGYYCDVHSGHDGKQFCCIFSNSRTNDQIWLVKLNCSEVRRKKVASSGLRISPEISAKFPVPSAIEYETRDGHIAYGLFYSPTKVICTLPPVIVFVHGGPTGAVLDRYNSYQLYFASRGYAVFSPNHRGSAGYGRAYREALNGNWGIYDVEDSCDGLEFLITKGLVDKRKAIIMGGSAGGYTTLHALLTRSDLFLAGVDMCGVADLNMLNRKTHLLEAHYMHSLVGSLPENADKYYLRSPLNYAERITASLIIFHGAKDTVVPKEHSIQLRDKVNSTILQNKLRSHVEYHEYPDEGHMLQGVEEEIWQKAEDFITRVLDQIFEQKQQQQ